MAEEIYKSPPILFGDKSSENEYQRKQREVTKKLLEATESESVTEFLVKLVYGEDFYLPARLLDTKIEAYGERVLQMADAIEEIESYNNFRGAELAEKIRYLHKGGYISSVKFGREGSPVVYVHAPYWTNQASNYKEGEHRKYTERERATMYSTIKSTLYELDPDELDEDSVYGVRAWWD